VTHWPRTGYNIDFNLGDFVRRCNTLFSASFLVFFSGCLIGDIFGSGDRNEFGENREKWLDAGIVSYTYREDRSCFCGFFGPADVTVINSQIVSVRRFLPDTTDIDPSNFDAFDTVEGLFDMVDDAIDRDAYQLEVTYDEELGFPTRIAIDYFENTIDDEITVTITAFAPFGGV